MAQASVYVGESATMAAESAVLGVPAVFVSTRGTWYTAQLERDYKLIQNVDNMEDCLHSNAYPKRKLDGIFAEESLRSIARSVASATNAVDIARFVETVFDAMCKFVDEAATIDFFMVVGDVRGSWK